MARYVIVLHHEDYVVGPFASRAEAERYVATDWQKEQLEIRELAPPSKGRDKWGFSRMTRCFRT